MAAESWRSMGPKDRAEFLAWTNQELESRWQVGNERYQSEANGFQGDPFEHLGEELLDALLYWYWEKRRRDGR